MPLLDSLKPFARTAKLRLLKRKADRLARITVAAERGESPDLPPPVFIFACGRSGTTILGKLFAPHPEVCYLREPYHLWAAIDPTLDVTNLHVRTLPKLWWDVNDATDTIRTRFARLILGERERTGQRVLIEKTPHNIFRIGLLEALTDGNARFIHIIRDGIDVARSIDRLASNQPYKMAGRSDYNQWWGSNDLKWQRLQAEGPGLLEITYRQLTAAPRETITALAAHVSASTPDAWLDEASTMLSPERKNKGSELKLPARMTELFNRYQEYFGYENRASAL
ncbi:hypothetical protein MNBD_PLANCTO03-351 [hydrothermal vent metagenome]|uniref:Sulfotransferase n=1 Tax=hydrothermal vent metagenome TaxID=652676 RepID=A0A3B1DI14_9ZZZZ